MNGKTNDIAGQVRQLLTEKLHEWRDGAYPVWTSTWPVFKRLIERHDEMKGVYNELEDKALTKVKLWILLERCIFAGAFATTEKHAALRADYLELQVLTKTIPELSIQLAQLIRRRREILNRSGFFHVDYRVRLTEYIDEAACSNELYRTYIQPEMNKLNCFDLKYWPDMADLLHVQGEERSGVECTDDATAAIVSARRGSLTDFFREFFSELHDISDGSPCGLPVGFRLTDGGMATLSNIICDLPPEEMIDEGYIRRLRQRLKEQELAGVW